MWCWFSVCPHRAIVNLLQPASTQCDVGPVCVLLLSAYFSLPQLSVILVQCEPSWSYCQPTSTCLNPVWCWSCVSPCRAIVNLLQPASTKHVVGPVCVIIELMSIYVLQPASTQCGVGPVCVCIELFQTLLQPGVLFGVLYLDFPFE